MKWYPKLPEALSATAYIAGKERAWPKEQALTVIRFLNENGYVVTKIDVWIPTNPGPTIPTPYVYDWSLNRSSHSGMRSKAATEFVESFEWDVNDKSSNNAKPVFNIWAEPLAS